MTADAKPDDSKNWEFKAAIALLSNLKWATEDGMEGCLIASLIANLPITEKQFAEALNMACLHAGK